MESVRVQGKDLLSQILKNDNNVRIIENVVYTICTTDDQYIDYNDLMYEVMGYILKRKGPLKDCMNDIVNRKIYWNNPCFDNYKECIVMKQDIASQIEEGVLECFKCKSKKIISFQKQIRSADEGITTFSQCSECGNKWKNNN